MDYSVDTPFRTYQEIQEAIKTKRATLSYQRSAAYNVACRANSINVISNLIIPIVSVVAMLAACSFFSISKWVLLFGIAVLFVNTLVPRLKGLFWFLAIAFVEGIDGGFKPFIEVLCLLSVALRLKWKKTRVFTR